jgi:hypothetical protein
MQELVRDPKSFLGKDKHGNQWFSKILQDGKEKWAKAYGNKVKSGGTSKKPGFYDSELGLIKENSPAYKEFLKRERLKITKEQL